MMAAGQRAYRLHIREQRRHDHEIEMACIDDDEGDRAEFIRLAIDDEMQQAQEQHEQEVYYDLMVSEEEEQQEQALFMQEVYYDLMETELPRPFSSDISTGAAGSLAGSAGAIPKERT